MTKTTTIPVREYFSQTADRLEQCGHLSTGRNYRKTMKSFMAFEGTRKYRLDELTPDVIVQYNQYLVNRGTCRNTQSFYQRNLRAVYNRAVQDGYAPPQPALFDDVYTGVDQTVKRSLRTNLLCLIRDLDLTDDAELALSRDLFLFSFYARGMSFVDMAYLVRSQIDGQGILHYARSKTGQSLLVRLEPCMKRIIMRHEKDCHADYVFPILTTKHPVQAFKEYEYRLQRHNLMLKEIGRRCHVRFPLSFLAARHSWATLARDMHVPISVISAGMGHSSELITRIYLAQLDAGEIDNANRRILCRLDKLG